VPGDPLGGRSPALPAAGRTEGPLLARLARYQAERFPLAGFVPLIALFTFASASFSRLSRGASGGFAPAVLAVGIFTSLVCFFILRVLDEHKDADDDQRYRPELPVPRGLVTLRELRGVGAWLLAVVVVANAIVMPKLLLPLAGVAVWATFMTLEFGVRHWLRAHMAAYLLTHMAILPVIDVYTTGLDWLSTGTHPPVGVLWFLGVTFANGVMIEIGRKLRVPDDERPGVDTYTCAWGLQRAPLVWTLALAVSAALSMVACRHAGWSSLGAWWFAALALVAALPAMVFVLRPQRGLSKAVDAISQAWPAVTYLLLGVWPLLRPLLGGRP